MSEKLLITTSGESDCTRVAFEGIIDEDANFEVLLKLNSKRFDFDFGAIELINSCGIREWTNFIRSLPNGTEIKYFNCSPEIIEQVNMIVDFLGADAHVETFFAPYFCEHCDNEEKVLLRSSEITNKKAPEKKCSKCNQLLEFDALEDQYFGFLKK